MHASAGPSGHEGWADGSKGFGRDEGSIAGRLMNGAGRGTPRRGAEMLFQVLTEGEERSSVAIASNESFGGWTKTFTDPRLCAAIVDRLTFNGAIIETGAESYRLAQTKARQQARKWSGGRAAASVVSAGVVDSVRLLCDRQRGHHCR